MELDAGGAANVAALIRALGSLQPDATILRQIARLLGLEDTTSESAGDLALPPTSLVSNPPPQAGLTSEAELVSSDTNDLSGTEADGFTLSVRRITRGRSQVAPMLMDVAPTVEPIQISRLSLETPTSRPEGLFRPAWEARIFQAVVTEFVRGITVDVKASVENSARLRAITNFPTIRRRRLKCNVELLVDVGRAMQPFAADQVQLRAELPMAIGEHRVRVTFFAASPLAGAGSGARSDWKPYSVPSKPMALLIVSDFAAGAAPAAEVNSAEDFVLLAQMARSAGHSVLGITPYSLAGVPESIRQAMSVIEWSRETRVRDCLHAAVRRHPLL